jgi:hypothetical protein
MWVSTCLIGVIVTILLHYLFSHKENKEIKYRNNFKKILREFRNHLLSIFYYY